MGNTCCRTLFKKQTTAITSVSRRDQRPKQINTDINSIALEESINYKKTLESRLLAVKKAQDFSFNGQRFLARIVDYYDGDTIRCAFAINQDIVQYRSRMAGYDSPEMKPLKTNINRDVEKQAAIIARDALISKINDKLVYIECGHFDKYGRLLVTVYARNGHKNGENINTWMIKNNYGTPYTGGKKIPFSDI